MQEETHIISMSSRFLGKWGKRASWCLYLFICYASLVAYSAGGGLQIEKVMEYLTGWTLSRTLGCLIFMATLFDVN
jgi:tyrosine-specific transport protein